MKQFLTLFILCFVSMNIKAQTLNGLVAHYPFSGNATDAMGTVNGTVSNATLTSDRFGTPNSAYSFTSSGNNRSFIGLGNNFNPTLSGNGSAFSISVWFKRAGTTQSMILFAKHANSGYCGSSEGQVSLHVNSDGSLRLNYHENAIATNYENTISQITDTLWHHLVVTYDGGIGIGQDRTDFYVDNNLWTSVLTNSGADVNAIIGNAAHAAIGHALTTTGTLCFNSNYGSDGSIDEVRLYNRVLPICDINGLYNEGNTTNGLIAHYPFSGDATDAVGIVDGTVSNAALMNDRFGTPNSAYSFTSSGSNRSFIGLGNNFNSVLSGSGSKFSISVWFKRADTTQSIILFAKHSNSVYCGSSDGQVSLHVNSDGSLRLNYHENAIATNYENTISQITDTLWHHLVVTYDGGIGIGQDRTDFYVDNNLWTSVLTNSGADVNAITGNAAHAAIGHVLTTAGTLCSSNTYGSDGGIDDVRLYNRVLGLCDIDSLYTPNTTLSINEVNDSEVSLKLYPNPVGDVLNLNLKSTTSFNQELNVQVINLTGQVLKSQVLESNTMSIEISQLATGVYFVRVLDGARIIAIQKMIKY